MSFPQFRRIVDLCYMYFCYTFPCFYCSLSLSSSIIYFRKVHRLHYLLNLDYFFFFFLWQGGMLEISVFLLFYCSLLSGPNVFVLMYFSICCPVGSVSVRDLKILHLNLPKTFTVQTNIIHLLLIDLSNPTQRLFFH